MARKKKKDSFPKGLSSQFLAPADVSSLPGQQQRRQLILGQKLAFQSGFIQGKDRGIQNVMLMGLPQYKSTFPSPVDPDGSAGTFNKSKVEALDDIKAYTGIPPTTTKGRMKGFNPTVSHPSYILDPLGSIGPTDNEDLNPSKRVVVTDLGFVAEGMKVEKQPRYPIRKSDRDKYLRDSKFFNLGNDDDIL